MRKGAIQIASVMFLLVSLAGAGFYSAAYAQCEYPMFVQEGAVSHNILLLFDSSGSMTTAVFHDDYDPMATYTGPFDPAGDDFNVYSDGLYSPNDFDSNLPTTPLAPLVTSDMGNSGRYTRHYLNWVFYHATDAQRAALPQLTRIEVARPAVVDIINSNPDLRFGVWKFNGTDGALMLSDVGTPHADIITQVNAIDPGGYTPISESLVDIYNHVTENTAAIQYSCQNTFIVVMTDGLPTQDNNQSRASGWAGFSGDSDGDGEWMDDVTRYMRTHDAMSDNTNYPGDQLVYTYTIGFNVDANVLDDAAAEGGGLYVSAGNAAALTASLEAVLDDIVNRISAGSAVAVVSTEGGSDNLLLRSKFLPGKWFGYLEAFALPYTDGDGPVWEAGTLLQARSAASRTVYTSQGGSMISFDDTYANTLRPTLGVATDQDAADLINWTRGDDFAYLRDHENWKLGDAIDSSPIVVGAPFGFHLYGDYLTWRDANKNRTRAIYIGGNDGMLHCFAQETGEELWAYVPEVVLPRLVDLADQAYCHEYFMNLTPRVFDAYVGGTWRTVLVAGQKQGGDAYVAMDITVPESPQLLWEASLPNIFESWTIPEVTRPESLGETVVFVGSGLDEATGRAYIKAISLETGQEVYEYQLSDNGGTGANMATGARSVDLNFDGWTDLVYVADLEGHLWRIDLNDSPWDVDLLFQAEAGQSIQAQPILTVDYNNDVLLYFGTGRYLDVNDLSDTTPQTYYAIIDKHDEVAASRLDLVDQTTSINPIGANDRGWYIDLEQAPGERVIDTSTLVAGIVYFASFQPSDEPCSAGGVSYLYKVDYRNGSAHDDDDDETNDVATGRVEEIGDGIATKPVVDVANEDVIIQGSDTSIHVRDAVGNIQRLLVRSWRQLYN